MKLEFSLIKNGTIFESDFQNLTPTNGTIEFKHLSTSGGIAVLYAPNGTGKSSFAKVLGIDSLTEELSFSVSDDSGSAIIPGAFHIIPDQINRNVIRGKETDYLIGRQIRREYELRDRINIAFNEAYMTLADKYKKDYKVSKVGDFLLTKIQDRQDNPYQTSFIYLRSIVNSRTHGKDIEQSEFVAFVRSKKNMANPIEMEPDKKNWVIADCSGKAKIVERIINLDYHTIIANHDTVQIERYDDAIGILKKYHTLDTCIVCDHHDFHGDDLLSTKQNNRKRIYNGLDQKTKDLLDKVVKENSLVASDPFDIKRIVSEFIAGGDSTEFHQLQINLISYVHAIEDEMIEALFHCFDDTSLFSDFDEYSTLVETTPQLDSEELLFIENVINESIGKDITIERDPESKNYKLKIGEKDLIGTERVAMELSSGEQNFISLAFELLLARHSDKEYVVLDDPISSFDSVYKNKIAFCIIKFLEQKKQIVLTHNTDLIRLLDVQLNNCFNLYILNNVEHGQNGFIPVNAQEKALLINLHELIKLFQNKYNVERGDAELVPSIINRRQFLMSMIPFMRGYSHIGLDPDDDFGTLSDIMHGYGQGGVDVVPIYKKLFGYDFGVSEVVTVEDILRIDCNNLDILDDNKFPLLSETLKQTLTYYHLRMKVEKELVDAFGLPTHEMDTLNQIIQRAFPKRKDVDERNRNFRVFFTSRKTLLNEFNHFEGNMNIFQPAIDINPTALHKEIDDIEAKLIEVRAFANSLS
ncbi:MAG: AAA family ATPase [Parasporobacterium sp.]|nr:AAA family ATPase [Parasporobacterium sp.]